MLEWHEWTKSSDPPPEDEVLLFAAPSYRVNDFWYIGAGGYIPEWGVTGVDDRLPHTPQDAWKGTIYWARFNIPLPTEGRCATEVIAKDKL